MTCKCCFPLVQIWENLLISFSFHSKSHICADKPSNYHHPVTDLKVPYYLSVSMSEIEKKSFEDFESVGIVVHIVKIKSPIILIQVKTMISPKYNSSSKALYIPLSCLALLLTLNT